MAHSEIDNGRPFDWGRTSSDYGRYRDIYPERFYAPLLERGLCETGMHILDLGTGTGVLPRALHGCGAFFTGADPSENQIDEARRLTRAAGMDVDYYVMPAERLDFPAASFDTVTALQCFWYFDKARALPEIARVLKPGGRFAVLSMEWLPYEDVIAGKSEELVLRYNPDWSGCGMKRMLPHTPAEAKGLFDTEDSFGFDLPVHFTRESWNGRMRSCRGIGASLPPERVADFDREHLELLSAIAPEEFDVLHYAQMLLLRVK